ncbi:MAG: hypothetical protein ABI832_02415 [bacterium]
MDLPRLAIGSDGVAMTPTAYRAIVPLRLTSVQSNAILIDAAG